MDAKSLTAKKDYVQQAISKSKEGMHTGDVLWAFGAYLATNEDAGRAFPMVLKVAYDEDWTDEKQMLVYYNDNKGKGDPGFEKAKSIAEPFLKWLAQGESSEEEDSDEDSSDED